MDEEHRFVMIETRNHINDGTEKKLVRYQLGNHLGSTAMELDQTGRVINYEEYHPYGTTAYQAVDKTIKAAAKRYRYTGMERDEESGLEYHSARYYMPWLGRWCSVDPLADKYPSLSSYIYCANNPIRNIDHDGKLIHTISPSAAEAFEAYLKSFGTTEKFDFKGAFGISVDKSTHKYFGAKMTQKDFEKKFKAVIGEKPNREKLEEAYLIHLKLTSHETVEIDVFYADQESSTELTDTSKIETPHDLNTGRSDFTNPLFNEPESELLNVLGFDQECFTDTTKNSKSGSILVDKIEGFTGTINYNPQLLNILKVVTPKGTDIKELEDAFLKNEGDDEGTNWKRFAFVPHENKRKGSKYIPHAGTIVINATNLEVDEIANIVGEALQNTEMKLQNTEMKSNIR
jgi:RHS repeat-associated protein